jgi:hypothetical protein
MNAAVASAFDAQTGIEASVRTPTAPTSAADAPHIPPIGPRYTTVLLASAWVTTVACVIGSAVLVLVFAARTVAFAGTWTESIAAGPARKLFAAIAVLLLAVFAIAALGWLRGELS